MGDFKLLRGFFPDMDDATWKTLAEDPDFLEHVPSLVKARLDSRDRFTPIDDSCMMLLMADADFASSEEQVYISSKLGKYFHNNQSLLPVYSDYVRDFSLASERGYRREMFRVSEDFASRCLFGLAFFRPALEKRRNRYAAPSPEFYQEMGKRAYQVAGREMVASNFESWGEFLRREFGGR